MSIQLQPPVPLVKTEPLTVIKNEPPEEVLEKETIPDIKEIDIVYHSLSEDLIKSETVPENILETKYLESVETQVLVKTEDTRDVNVTRATGQEIIEVQGPHEHSNTLSNLEPHEKLVLNSSKDLNGISTSSKKAKRSKKKDFAQCYKTNGTSSGKEKIKIIRAPVSPIEPHEYTSLAKDKLVCNHCQHASPNLKNLKRHIRKMHREVTTMYQCHYCLFKSKYRSSVMRNHKDWKDVPRDVELFQCHLCKLKFNLESSLSQHLKIHLKPKQMQDVKPKQMRDGLDLCKKRVEPEHGGVVMVAKNEFVHEKRVELKHGGVIMVAKNEFVRDKRVERKHGGVVMVAKNKFVSFSRCYNCQAFDHKSNTCTKIEACGNCAGNHSTLGCERQKSCINCKIANEKYGLRLNTDHTALDSECPSLKYHIGLLKTKMDYN